MANEEKPTKTSFSFGFSKKKSTKLQTSAIKDDEVRTNEDQATFVESFDGKRLEGDQKKALVIPLIQNNRWQNPQKPEDLEKDEEVKKAKAKLIEGDSVETQAANEILRAAAGEDVPDDEKERTVPLLMQNKVPDGFETDDLLNVDLRPESSVEADYEQIPIEEYGKALLRGMGWKEGMGVGKKGRYSKPIDAVLRPKGLGLGADRSVQKQATNGDKDTENLTLTKGACCFINSGKHKDFYGMVEGVDPDNARAVVKMALSKDVVTVSQFAVTLVSKKDYEKNSKVLNKTKVDKYKEAEEKKNSSRSSDGRDRHKDKEERTKDRHRDKHGDRHRDREDRDREDRDKDRDRQKNKYRDDDRSGSDHKHKKRRHEESGSRSRSSKSLKNMWLRPHLRVRVVDPEYQKGKYFKTKVIIEDVVGPGECICRTDEGKVLEHVDISMLETVIPRSEPAYVMVVKGEQMGKLGEILRKDKSSSMAMVQLLHNRDEVQELSYDNICDYTGNIEQEFDY